jgi:hypothetical protein
MKLFGNTVLITDGSSGIGGTVCASPRVSTTGTLHQRPIDVSVFVSSRSAGSDRPSV